MAREAGEAWILYNAAPIQCRPEQAPSLEVAVDEVSRECFLWGLWPSTACIVRPIHNDLLCWQYQGIA